MFIPYQAPPANFGHNYTEIENRIKSFTFTVIMAAIALLASQSKNHLKP